MVWVKWTKAQDAHDVYVAILSCGEDEAEKAWIEDLSNRFDFLEVVVTGC